jgi:hypothetical protein
MSAVEVVQQSDVEVYREVIRTTLKQGPTEIEGVMICPVCERGFDPRGIAPHMDMHRRHIGDLPPRGKRGPNRPKVKQRTVVIEQTEPDLRITLREQLIDRINRISDIEDCEGLEEEFGEGTIDLLQARRSGLEGALDLLDGL